MRYGYSFTWNPRPGSTCRVTAKWFASEEEMEKDWVKTLIKSGYTRPRWWQYWRWGESRPGVYDKFILECLNLEDDHYA